MDTFHGRVRAPPKKEGHKGAKSAFDPVFPWIAFSREAASKEVGLDPVVLYDLLKSFPKQALSSIKWIIPRTNDVLFAETLNVIAHEMFEGLDNTLCVAGNP